MEFFGIGMPEMMMILVIAIVIFGPDKIPSMVGQVTKAIRDFRRYTSDLTKEFNEATGGLRDEFATITNDLKSELAQTQADLRSQLDLTDAFRMDTPAAPVTVAATSTTDTLPLTGPPVATEPVISAEPEQTITVTTPYADALATSPNGATNGNGTNGHTTSEDLALTVPLATKADPFADLVVLTRDDGPQEAAMVAAASSDLASTSPELVTVGAEAMPAAFAVADDSGADAAPAVPDTVMAGTDLATNGAKPRVGGSVTGSKYARRRKA